MTDDVSDIFDDPDVFTVRGVVRNGQIVLDTPQKRRSPSTAPEVLARSGDEYDRHEGRGFLADTIVGPTTVKVIRTAGRLLRAVPVPHRLTPGDAPVAAAAGIEKLPVYSPDPGRYAGIPGLTALPAR